MDTSSTSPIGEPPDYRPIGGLHVDQSPLISMTQNLALAPDIQVHVIAPGAILPPPGEDQSYLAGLVQRIPVRPPT